MRWSLLLIIAVLVGCAHGPAAVDAQAMQEFIRCAKPEAALPPPGTYLDQGIRLDYERLAPRPETGREIKASYFRETVVDLRRLEQLYHDATHGNERAIRVICLMEAGARSAGRTAAHELAALACRSTHLCGVRYDRLPFSTATASGRRTLVLVGEAFEGEAARLAVQVDVATWALSLLVGAEMVSQLGRIPRLEKASPRLKKTAPLLDKKASLPLSKQVLPVDKRALPSLDQKVLGEMRGTGPVQSFRSFKAFQRATGPAGPGKQWHHIVEQNPANKKRFRPEELHNTSNVIRIDTEIHQKINAHYSSKTDFSSPLTVREWLSKQSFEAQLEYGIQTLRRLGVLP